MDLHVYLMILFTLKMCNNYSMKLTTKRSGIAAITLIVLFTTVLGLSLALFYITNARTGLKETTFTVEGNQALSCAESGVDIAIQCIKTEKEQGKSLSDIQKDCKQNEKIPLDQENPNTCQYSYNLDIVSDSIYLTELEKNESELIVLDSNASSTKVNIRWQTEFSSTVHPNGNILETSLLKKLDDGTYKYTQVDYKCNFSDVSINKSVKSFVEASYKSGDNKYCEINSALDASGNDYLVITPRYNYARNINISIASNNVPGQGFEIKSTGYSGKVVRDIKSYLLTEGKSASILRVLNNTIYSNGYNSK